MLKIRDLEVNQNVVIPLVVSTATARETKAKKPYLQIEFYDGSDKIGGNYWDWAGKNIPSKNVILDVTAQVTEWQGVKQLNVKSMSTNTELHISEFSPDSGLNLDEVYKDAYCLLCDVKDDMLRNLALSLLEELKEAWLVVPGAKSIHHAFIGGTLIHSLSVAKLAKSMAADIPDANIDLCTVGGFLHDIGKLYTYNLNGVTIEMTDEGMLYEHLFMGAEFIGTFAENTVSVDDSYVAAKLEMLRHIILSHHGKQEYGAVVPPHSIEAHIVYHADSVDSAAQQVMEQSKKLGHVKWTDRIWALENRPHLTTQYVQAVFLGEGK